MDPNNRVMDPNNDGKTNPVQPNDKNYTCHYLALGLTIAGLMVVTCVVCGILAMMGEYGMLQMSALTVNALGITSIVLLCVNAVAALILRLKSG